MTSDSPITTATTDPATSSGMPASRVRNCAMAAAAVHTPTSIRRTCPTGRDVAPTTSMPIPVTRKPVIVSAATHGRERSGTMNVLRYMPTRPTTMSAASTMKRGDARRGFSAGRTSCRSHCSDRVSGVKSALMP